MVLKVKIIDMAKDNRTIFDLNDDEYEDYQNRDDETSQQITQNTIEDALNMMFPDGNPDDE